MQPSDIIYLKDWFIDYVAQFSSDREVKEVMELKKEHIFRVMKEARTIGEELNLTQEQLMIAEAGALLHDIGRFEQYAKHKTFVDRVSVDHAEFGVKIIESSRILERFDDRIQALIIKPILYHNKASLPAKEDEECLFFTRLLRDADKVDIFELICTHYRNPIEQHEMAISLGFPDTSDISDEVVKTLERQSLVDYRHIKNLNDFKLLQLGWVYDINFQPTFRIIQERKFLTSLYATLPQTKKLNTIFAELLRYVEEKLKKCPA